MKKGLLFFLMLVSWACVQLERDGWIESPRRRLNPLDTLDSGGAYSTWIWHSNK